jgi:hypothetical protein
MNDTSNRFWLAVMPASHRATESAFLEMATPFASHRRPLPAIAVEVLLTGHSCWTLVVSVADSMNAPHNLHAVFGVSEDPSVCDEAATFGVPLIEGHFDHHGAVLRVRVPAYPARTADAPASPRPQTLITIEGIDVNAVTDGDEVAFAPVYEQLLSTPDLSRPDTEMIGRTIRSAPGRADVRRVPSPVTLRFEDVLYPDLVKLFSKGTAASAAVWTGIADPWRREPQVPTQRRSAALTSFPRASVFGPAQFAFEDVEIVGFRTELTGGVDELEPLVRPLNFHRGQRRGPVDFFYKAATATVIIELLRYGKMRAPSARLPFREDDFMSQHELLVRILVGRVDDDTAQARDAAMFVPTIFVDNPWSKAVGRGLQGFPKVLAEFRAGPDLLDMSGHGPSGNTVPLHQITDVRIARHPASATAEEARLVTLMCPDAETGGSEDQFMRAPLPSILGGTLFRRSRFDQFDFDEVEFRRSFARKVLADQFKTYAVVQAAPVTGLIDLPRAWITGRCELRDVEVAFPSGVASVVLSAPASAPQPWKDLCGLIPQSEGGVGFPTGDWYRVRCSMTLTADDTLAW